MEPGTHSVKIKTYGVAPSKSGAVNVVLQFEDEAGQTISSYKSFSEKAIKYTFSDLETCGLTKENATKIEMMAAGIESGILDHEKELSIVVENDTYEGVTRAKVKWINEPGGLQNVVSVAEAKVLFDNFGIKSAAMAYFENKKQPTVIPPRGLATQTDAFSADDVPF